MAESKKSESKILIAQGLAPIVKPVLKEVIRRIFDAGDAGTIREDEYFSEKRRRESESKNPQPQDNSIPFKPQQSQTEYSVQPTLPAKPIIQPIPIPPYQPPVNQPAPAPSPNPDPSAKPYIDPNIERDRKRAQEEYDALERESAERQRKNDEINRRSADRAREYAEQQENYDKARSRLFNDALRENQREKDEQERNSRRVDGVVPSTDNPFGGSDSFIWQNNNPFGASQVLQTNESSGEASFGDKLVKAIALSVGTGVLKKEFLESMQKILTPESLATMGGLLAVVGSANIAAAAIAPPIGTGIATVVSGAIATFVVAGNIGTLVQATPLLFGFLTKAYSATTEAEFLAAANDFAKFVNVVGPDVVLNMTGAKAGKALGAISGRLASLGSELAGLSPERQKQIRNGLESGRKLLDSLGENIQNGFKGIFKSIDDALQHLTENKSTKIAGETVSPTPGKDPKKDKKPQLSRWDKISDEIKLDLGKDKLEFKELEINLGKLKAKGLNPETVLKLYKQDIPPSTLDVLLNDTRGFEKLLTEKGRGKRGLDEAIKPEFQELADLTTKFLDQMLKQPNAGDKVKVREAAKEAAKDFIQYAVSDRRIYKFAKELIDSGKLKDTKELGKAVKDFATQPNISGALGYQFEVEFAAQLVRSGNNIRMGKGADVVDHTSKQAWQLKNSHDSKSFGDALNDAAFQLTGGNGEKPPLGYLKGIKVRITGKENPEYLKSPEQLVESIKEAISTDKGKKWKIVDQVQIIIDDKTHVFNIKKGLEGIVPVYQKTYKSAPFSISEVPAEARVVKVQNTSSQLLSALDKYRQAVKKPPAPEQSRKMQISQQVLASREFVATQRKLSEISQNIQKLNAQVAGQTFNTRGISPNILWNASPTDLKAVAYASAQLLKYRGQQAFVSRESGLEVAKINDTGQVTLYSHRLSAETAQNILEAAQQLQQEQTMQTARNNKRNFEIGG